jgi:hypothetical protein
VKEVTINEDRNVPFIFVSEALVLDLINTVVVVRGSAAICWKHHWMWRDGGELACQHHPQMDKVDSDLHLYNNALLSQSKPFVISQRRLFTSIVEGHHPENDEIEVLNSF